MEKALSSFPGNAEFSVVHQTLIPTLHPMSCLQQIVVFGFLLLFIRNGCRSQQLSEFLCGLLALQPICHELHQLDFNVELDCLLLFSSNTSHFAGEYSEQQ